MVKKRGLGSGLDTLLGSKPRAKSAEKSIEQEVVERMTTLSVDMLQRGKYQPRKDIAPAQLEELAASIKEQGVIQPIIVRSLGKESYEIIAGERRWRAAQQAGLHEVPVVVRDVDDKAAIAMAVIENIQREDLNPIEEANAIQRLIEEFDMTQQQAADAVGRSRSAVTNLLRLLTLTAEVRMMVENGDLEMGHSRALLALTPEQQLSAAKEIVEKVLTARAAEQLVKRIQSGQNKKSSKAVNKRSDPNIIALQDKLTDQLGAAVLIKHGNKGKGKLIIDYKSLDELDGILEHIV